MVEERRTQGGVRQCGLNSGKGLLKSGGELVAIAHHVPATGFKAKNAYGSRAIFNDETTKGMFDKRVTAATQSTATSKKLVPYHPNAPRNRPKESKENHVGNRFGIHPCIKCDKTSPLPTLPELSSKHRHERYRGSSNVCLKHEKDPDAQRSWKTTNQVFNETTSVQNAVGLANGGISSELAKRVHKKQGVYGPA